ncbi:MAG: hypothetical protein M1153_00215, partial [Patescibacteria group bacterium]|nr:hypothetical protein [Patescibacteria group bacterium]
GGNKSLTEEGKKWIVAAISGIVILILAYIMLNTINPEVLRINETAAPGVATPPAGTTIPSNAAPNVPPATSGGGGGTSGGTTGQQ